MGSSASLWQKICWGDCWHRLKVRGVTIRADIDGHMSHLYGVLGRTFYVVWSRSVLSLWTHFSEYDGDCGLYSHVLVKLSAPGAVRSVENACDAIAMRRFVFMCDSRCAICRPVWGAAGNNNARELASLRIVRCRGSPPSYAESGG